MSTNAVDRRLTEAIESSLSATVLRSSSVHGGDVAISYRVDLDDGRRVFAKTHRNPPPGFFSTEAAGLSWLGDADAVAVPTVLAVSDDDPAHLVLSWIDTGSRRTTATTTTERALGRGIARLHRAGAPCFGREDRRTTGSRRLPNDPAATWSEFYAGCRLLPLARLARDCGALADRSTASLEALAGTLDRFGLDDEPPSRLHGDLWAGNRLIDSDRHNWLIDPAAHGGHRESDLAMMRLFGGFGGDCFAAYDEAYPLDPDWSDRVELHQIAPLVVHAIKFAGSYIGAAEAAIARYV